MREGIFRLIGFQQIGEKTGGQRREDADPHHADLTASRRAGIFQCIFDAAERHTSVIQELAARVGEHHSARMTNEQRDADLIFQIADASADC